jgi:sec-independent protein translocase protein TatA
LKEYRMRSLGGPEILIIALVFLVLFGGKKLPDLAKGLGEGIRNFKNSFKGEEETKEEKK